MNSDAEIQTVMSETYTAQKRKISPMLAAASPRTNATNLAPHKSFLRALCGYAFDFLVKLY